MTKHCKYCNLTKSTSEFIIYKRSNGYIETSYYCKECSRLEAKERYWNGKSKPIIENIDGEIWVAVSGNENDYMVSNKSRFKTISRVKNTNGSVRHLDEKIISKYISKTNGYVYVSLNGNTHTSHSIIAKAFIPNPENKLEVNHKNGIRWDDSLDNLEWNTTQENAIHKFEVLKYKYPIGENNKLSRGVVIIHPDGHEEYVKGCGEAGRRLGASGGQMISKVINGQRSNYKGYKFRYAELKTA